MKQVQGYQSPPVVHTEMMQHATTRRLLTSLLIGAAIMLFLTLIEVAFLGLLAAFHLGGKSFGILLAQFFHPPSGIFLPAGELLVATVAAFLTARSVALAIYLRAVHHAQAAYHKLYTPLTALTNIRQTVEPYGDQEAMPTISMQEEEVSILDLVQQQHSHQLILGVPGAGKTMALRVYQYIASQNPLALAFGHERIPVYVPMKNYSLFLKQRQLSLAEEDEAQDSSQVTLFAYLAQSDLPGMRYLRPYIQQLADQGRLLLLCDGLNEVDSNYLTTISEELVFLMRHTRNRLVMACREVDYREQQDFVLLVDEGQAARAVIYPLQPEQVSEFVERYVEKQGSDWQHTAGQIMQVIDRSRLRYHCTNPMMLFTLMGIIDRIGVERGKQIDTRGRLLREYVKQLIEYERRQPKWGRNAPTEQEVIRFLSEIACAARWANDRNAIQLHVSSLATTDETRGKLNFDELADELQFWLDEHPAQSPFVTEVASDADPYDDRAQLLQFALSAALIEVSPSGVLSFRHELIAEYFVAEYFFAAANKRSAASQPIRVELLEQVGRWSEPVAIWAGLLDKPLELAERFGALGLRTPEYVLQALALGLVCVGVLWTPPQAEIQRTVILPPSIEEALSIAVRNKAAREELARIFTRCAEEGGQEVYRSLLPLITVEGVDDLLALLDHTIVPELLFTHLQDVVDNIAYETQVKRLARVLGRFGGAVVDRATQLSMPASERSLRLRAAAINILGGTNDPRAVEPLIARLRDAEPLIVERATNALIRLGPSLTLTRVLQELENRSTELFTPRVHRAALTILGRFLEEHDPQRQVSVMQYQHILERIVPVLTSNYQTEAEAQQQARAILVQQARATSETPTRDQRVEKVIAALVAYLPTQNEVATRNIVLTLQEIGTPATPRLIELLKHPSDLVRARVVEVLKAVRDLHALPALLRTLADPAPAVQQQIAQALFLYAPESIPGLLEQLLHDASDALAERASQILIAIGEPVVEPVIAVLDQATPTRARLLVHILEVVHDVRAIPALIALLQTPQLDTLLAITLVRALSQFPDPRVVSPLISLLSASQPQLYEEAITALSQLGTITLPDLLVALDVPRDTAVTQRARRAVLGMKPFPGEQLIEALEQSSQGQAEQIMAILRVQGPEAALVLARHLLHPDEQVRDYIHQALESMPGSVVVPALLEILYQPPMRKIATTFLLKYPDAAIPALVALLGEHERGSVVAAILPQFGSVILRPLLSALDDQSTMARELAQRIVVTLARQSSDPQRVLHEIVDLFNPPPPVRAREALLTVLTNELLDISLPALLDGLEDIHLIEDVSEAFVRISRKPALQQTILDQLVQALFVDERRRGAEIALIRIGAPAVGPVGELITNQHQPVAKSARHILCEIGVAALPFIWNAHSDRTSPARREAALEIFHSMPTEVIKDELVALLVGDRRDDIAMAVSLLLERIHAESKQHYEHHVMVPELIDYVQTHTAEVTNLRIIALLLLLGEHTIVDHLIQNLDEHPQHRKQLVYLFLLLSSKTHEILLEVFNDPEASIEFRTELAAILGMVAMPDQIVAFAQNISKYGLNANRTGFLHPEELSVALRALGGLLAGGNWNPRKLREMRDAAKNSDPAHELFSVLLGYRYQPQITKLQSELETQRETFNKERIALTGRIVQEQNRASNLETELEKIRAEHGSRGDELKETYRERDTLRNALEKLKMEKNTLQANLDQALKEKAALGAQLERTRKEYQAALALQKQNQPTQTNIR